MFRILTSWYRFLVYFVLISLITIVSAVGGWMMGLVIGIILSILIELFSELFSFLQNDTLDKIDKSLESFRQTLREQISVLKDFESITNEMKDINVFFHSSAVSKSLDFSNTGLHGKVTPIFLLNSSSKAHLTIQPGLTAMLLNLPQLASLFARSFDFVHKSYWGTSFAKIETWDFKPIEKEGMEKQKQLVKNNKEVRSVFVVGKDDSEVYYILRKLLLSYMAY